MPEMGSGHRAGGADLASGVDTAGTVARIDLRLPHHSACDTCEVASADSDTSARDQSQARARPASAATRQPPNYFSDRLPRAVSLARQLLSSFLNVLGEEKVPL